MALITQWTPFANLVTREVAFKKEDAEKFVDDQF